MQTLDCRGKKCPAPVIETRKFLLAQQEETVDVLVSDNVARENVRRLAESLGYGIDISNVTDGYRLRLTPGIESISCDIDPPPAEGKTVVYIGADIMGSGNEELGRVLLSNYLVTLLELDRLPDAIFFVNTGVKLVCMGHSAVEALQKLAGKGVDIAACGLCLEYFHLKEDVAVGRISNMHDIATHLNEAGRIIRP
ncbi:MAG: sulfurtransferase-like selenium metabolism protein YedF [Geoalkalibacter sp.]|jgi:selenium metabolism protein YedF|uniref:sulfurtransferase-like selenium metabolism protein YedF n=1 Tax=Geoalkalibacter sp. TaxID=3041440 RepID=UPI002A952AA1|nr:sulfurtransferase-like selenium metabolism protein YedF [Thermodesulfobacteriota bacterium]